MSRLGLTPSEKLTKRRDYTRENRAMWASLGFRMMSAPIHDDDRQEVLAEIEVKRCLRMARMADDKLTPLSKLVQLGSRNMSPPPPPKETKAFLDTCHNKENFDDIEYAVQRANKAHETYRNCQANMERTTDETTRHRLFSKEVAYGNLCAAWFKLANVRREVGDNKTVFDAKAATGAKPPKH